jgi:hypothetical protein
MTLFSFVEARRKQNKTTKIMKVRGLQGRWKEKVKGGEDKKGE